MGFQSVQIRYRTKPAAVPSIAPYYGMSTLALPTESMILNLSGRGPTAGIIDTTFTLNATVGQGLYQWFAYPAAYGTAQFLDTDSNFYGGWDGAHDDPQNIYGPTSVDVHVGGNLIPFYVYRTDYPDLGTCHWKSSQG
jgi:hypothetical protein